MESTSPGNMTFSTDLLEQEFTHHEVDHQPHPTAHLLTSNSTNFIIMLNSSVNSSGISLGSEDYYDYSYNNNNFGYITDFYGYAQTILRQPNSIVGLVLGIIALVANIISISAVCQIRKSWNSHMSILVSLMISDLLVDVSYIIHIVNTAYNPLYNPASGPDHIMIKSRCTYLVIKALNNTGLNITLLNIMAMAIEHFVAIMHPLSMHRVMNIKRCRIMIIIIWIIAFIAGFSDFITPVLDKGVQAVVTDNHNYCEVAWFTHYQEEYMVFAISIVCFSVITFMYLRIYCEIKQKHPVNLLQKKPPTNRKALGTTLLILGAFTICWLPLCLFNITIIIALQTNPIPEYIINNYHVLIQVDTYLYNLMLLNTLCDPIIYAVRISEIRTGYKLLFKKLLFCRKNQETDFVELGRSSRRGSSQVSWSTFTSLYTGRRKSSEARLEAVKEVNLSQIEMTSLMR